MHVQVDPALQGLFLLGSQFVFGDEVRMDANFEVENKTYAPTATNDSSFDLAITIHLRSKKKWIMLKYIFVLDIFLHCILDIRFS